MDWLNLIVLAVVQGVTEFLPISSSAHLILVPQLMDWQDQGLAIDVAMHIGTLIAVMAYFHGEVWRMIRGGLNLVAGRPDGDTRLLLQLALATIPVVIVGFLLRDIVATTFRSPLLIATTTIGFGILLWIADRKGEISERALAGMTYRDALLIGVFQAIALVPGVSRSGITMTAGLFLAFSRTEAPALLAALVDPDHGRGRHARRLGAGEERRRGAAGGCLLRRGAGLLRRIARNLGADGLAAAGELHPVRRLSAGAGRLPALLVPMRLVGRQAQPVKG
jgi:undecaprenyl-diphosphatase UppP